MLEVETPWCGYLVPGVARTASADRQVTGRRPGLLSEAGLGALQVWEHVAEAQGRGRGTTELAIVFTDLVDFSAWALEAGDDAALALLREVGCRDRAAGCTSMAARSSSAWATA